MTFKGLGVPHPERNRDGTRLSLQFPSRCIVTGDFRSILHAGLAQNSEYASYGEIVATEIGVNKSPTSSWPLLNRYQMRNHTHTNQ